MYLSVSDHCVELDVDAHLFFGKGLPTLFLAAANNLLFFGGEGLQDIGGCLSQCGRVSLSIAHNDGAGDSLPIPVSLFFDGPYLQCEIGAVGLDGVGEVLVVDGACVVPRVVAVDGGHTSELDLVALLAHVRQADIHKQRHPTSQVFYHDGRVGWWVLLQISSV